MVVSKKKKERTGIDYIVLIWYDAFLYPLVGLMNRSLLHAEVEKYNNTINAFTI